MTDEKLAALEAVAKAALQQTRQNLTASHTGEAYNHIERYEDAMNADVGLQLIAHIRQLRAERDAAEANGLRRAAAECRDRVRRIETSGVEGTVGAIFARGALDGAATAIDALGEAAEAGKGEQP